MASHNFATQEVVKTVFSVGKVVETVSGKWKGMILVDTLEKRKQ